MQLYDYQKRVAQCIRQGQSVILQAPTGAGKTLAALWPFIEMWDRNQPSAFPHKCIYSVPMRVLATQFREEIDALVNQKMILAEPPKVSIQTGDQSEDPKFERDLIFATIDQSLSSALAVPYSLSSGMANLNAGAFFSSYLIFDEFHLFPLADETGAEGALTTVLQLLTQVKGIVPFVLMTATFSSTMLTELAALLDAEVVQVPADEYRAIAQGQATRPRQRRYQIHTETLDAKTILEQHKSRTLVICNQVQRAQDLFIALQQQADLSTRVELLHSRFLPEDRRAKETEIRCEFGKDQAQRTVESMIVVATQVIEVGLDITCETLHTEIAPANAVFQRAGRCARYPGEEGIVHIYQVPLRKRSDGISYRDHLPYLRPLCEGSWQSFVKRDGAIIDFVEEQAVIDEVHTESDRQLLAAMKRQQGMLWNDIYAAMQEGAREQRRNLIRRVDNITVLSAPTPMAVGDPLRAQGFGLWRGTVKGLMRTLEEYESGWSPEDDEENWLMQFPTFSNDNPDDPTTPVDVRWHEVTDPSLLDGTGIVVINSAFCDYNKELGFRVVSPEAGGWSSQPGEKVHRNSQSGYSYQLESYSEHITNMLTVYRREFAAGYAYLGKRLERIWQVPAGGLTNAIETAIALHDLAKMDQRWQRWVRLYQNGIGEPITDDTYMAVHTHWEPYNPTHKQAKQQADRQCKRPPHAGESAIAGAQIIGERCGNDELTRAVLTAITRHHSAQAYQFQDYALHPAAATAATAALALTTNGPAQANLIMTAPPIKLDEYLVEPEKFRGLLLYLWIVRVLRLCDGLSQEEE